MILFLTIHPCVTVWSQLTLSALVALWNNFCSPLPLLYRRDSRCSRLWASSVASSLPTPCLQLDCPLIESNHLGLLTPALKGVQCMKIWPPSNPLVPWNIGNFEQIIDGPKIIHLALFEKFNFESFPFIEKMPILPSKVPKNGKNGL